MYHNHRQIFVCVCVCMRNDVYVYAFVCVHECLKPCIFALVDGVSPCFPFIKCKGPLSAIFMLLKILVLLCVIVQLSKGSTTSISVEMQGVEEVRTQLQSMLKHPKDSAPFGEKLIAFFRLQSKMFTYLVYLCR